VNNPAHTQHYRAATHSTPRPGQPWVKAFAILVWIAAAVSAFLPFALNTSPWDAVTLRVPGNQGNWWHVLVGVPFFLAFPMVWLRLRSVFVERPPATPARQILWTVSGISIFGTILVEIPFLLHLAGTSSWQRFLVLGLGFGIIACSAAVLIRRRHRLSPTVASMVSIDTAYLANAALCLVVYSEATGPIGSRIGWFVSIVIFWPILLELVWLLTCPYSEIANV